MEGGVCVCVCEGERVAVVIISYIIIYNLNSVSVAGEDLRVQRSQKRN